MAKKRTSARTKTNYIVKKATIVLSILVPLFVIQNLRSVRTPTNVVTKQVVTNDDKDKALIVEASSKTSATIKEKSSDRKTQSDSSQLYFIMHVGPMKTATSSIQCSLMNLETQGLLPDNVVFAESQYKSCYRMIRSPKNTIMGCFKNWKPQDNGMPSCWGKYYEPYIREQEKQNQSIIVSQENLSWLTNHPRIRNSLHRRKSFLKSLKKSLGDRYQIVVIMTYRAFFDWIYSYYSQHNKMGESGRRDFDHWPDEGGKARKTIRELADKMVSDGGDRKFFADKIIDFFSSTNNITIKVMNLDDGDILKQFFCDGLPQPLSRTMCNLVDKIVLEGDMNAAPDNLWANALAIKAHENGIIETKNVTRSKVIYDILDYQKEQDLLNDNFPLICPDKDFFESLLKKTVELYSNVYKDVTDEQKRDKELQYREKLSKKRKKFCELDTSTMIEQENWKSFFRRYSTENIMSRI